jgi:V8-like Glu-specific endopeptidase
MNSELEGNRGGCYGDSGSPKFIHDTNTAVAITTGGDPICRANSNNSRLDTSQARTFYRQYLALP